MGYMAPVTDRTAEDITNKTSKAFWNVEDFERVYENSRLASALAAIMLEDTILFTILSTPAITTIPNVDEFNAFLQNIEEFRAAAGDEGIAGAQTPIKYNYVAGLSEAAPTYVDANLWESTIDAIWVHFGGPNLEVCPTLSADLVITTGNQEVYVDCIDANGFNIELQGTARLYII